VATPDRAPTCPRCGRPLDATDFVCFHCGGRLGEDLAAVPGYVVDELPVARYRLTRFRPSGRGEWSEPWDERAARAELEATETLGVWARWIVATRGLQRPASAAVPPRAGPVCRACLEVRATHASCLAVLRPARVRHPAVVAALLIGRHVGWLRHRPEASLVFAAVHNVVDELRRAVDRPGDLWWAGPCTAVVPVVDEQGEPYTVAVAGGWAEETRECTADLYARPAAPSIRCRVCGTVYDAGARRDWLYAEAQETYGHAEWLARALTVFGREVNGAEIRGYARRGRLAARTRPAGEDDPAPAGPVCDGQPCGHASCSAIAHPSVPDPDEAGRPVYRLGAVLAVLDDLAAAEAARALARRQAEQARQARRAKRAQVVG
jgi:hypothetical protein